MKHKQFEAKQLSDCNRYIAITLLKVAQNKFLIGKCIICFSFGLVVCHSNFKSLEMKR